MIFLSNTSTDVCEYVYVYIYEHSNANFKLYKHETSIVPIKMRFTYGLSLLSRIKMSLFNNLAWDQNVVTVPLPLSYCNTVVPWHHVLFFTTTSQSSSEGNPVLRISTLWQHLPHSIKEEGCMTDICATMIMRSGHFCPWPICNAQGHPS